MMKSRRQFRFIAVYQIYIGCRIMLFDAFVEEQHQFLISNLLWA